MKTRIALVFMTAMILSIGIIVLWNKSNPTVSGQSIPSDSNEDFAFGQLNVSAASLNQSGSLSDANAVVEEILNIYGVVLPADVKSRIADSEVLYRSQQRGGVPEINVVRAVNGLAMKFNAPDFAKTDLYEVRKLRFSLMAFAPQFVAHGRPAELNRNSAVNSTIVETMSPAEAVFVMMTVLYQKKSNPNYQLTDAEKQAKWGQTHSLQYLGGLPKEANKTQQIETAVNDATATMSAVEILAIPDRALDILGIEQ